MPEQTNPAEKLLQGLYLDQSLYQNMPCGYLITDPKGVIYFINDTLTEWLGYPIEEVLKIKSFQDLLPPGENIFYESRHSLMLKLQSQVNEINYNIITCDGERIPVLVNSNIIKDEDGEIAALQFIFIIYSDRKKYEKELLVARKRSEEAAAAKSNFLSLISHEVKTPIHAIINSIEILSKDDYTAKQSELLEVIHHSGSNLLDFINSVLSITNMEAGKMVTTDKPFNLHFLLRQLLSIYRSLAQKKNIDFQLILDPDVPESVIGDKNCIRQVLINLVGNAIKFTQNGKITLTVTLVRREKDDYTVRFNLQDSGIGIKKEELERIFKPFTQANNTIQQSFGGTGLGLSISRQILHLLGSEIHVKSKPGEGSTFTFDLVLPESPEKVVDEDDVRTEWIPKKLDKIKVLIVDDVYSNIIVINRFLEIWGVAHEHAFSGAAALDKIREDEYDIVLMDINMPDLDGYMTTQLIRELPGKKKHELPVIALSAYDVSEIEYKVRQAGMNDILTKPFKSRDLHRLLQKWTAVVPTSVSPEAEPEEEKTVPTGPSFSLQKLSDLFDGKPDAILRYLSNAVMELNLVIEEFRTAKETYSQEIFRSAVHKNATKVGMFDLHDLKALMMEGDTFIQAGKRVLYEEKCDEIIAYLQSFKIWIQKEADEVQVTEDR